jgi:uncharacterized protein YqgC (DUF456 family)
MESFAHILLAVIVPALFLVLATVAWALIVFQVPGTWIMILLALLYGLIEGFKAMNAWVLLVGVAIALTGEAVEWGMGYFGAKGFGGSRAAGWAALGGSVAGAVLGAAFGWGLGAIPGTILGAFAGALIVEAVRLRHAGKALKAGIGAGVGRAVGLATKLGMSGAFLALLYVRVLWTAFKAG